MQIIEGRKVIKDHICKKCLHEMPTAWQKRRKCQKRVSRHFAINVLPPRDTLPASLPLGLLRCTPRLASSVLVRCPSERTKLGSPRVCWRPSWPRPRRSSSQANRQWHCKKYSKQSIFASVSFPFLAIIKAGLSF